MHPFDLTGKRAFIPGGYGGIGEAVAQALAQAGATVTVAGRSREKAEARDVAGATLFFCSSAADFVTGQVLYVDGGITASQ